MQHTTMHFYRQGPWSTRAYHGVPSRVLQVWSGGRKDAITELNRLHLARRIEPHDEVKPAPVAAVARGPEVKIAHGLFGVACGNFHHGKAGYVQKQAHEAGSTDGLYQAH